MRVIFFSLLLLLVSCGKNEFFLEFNLADDITDNYNVTYYASTPSGGVTVQAVASVMNGKCELQCFTKSPTLVYITPKRSNFPLIIYAEKGNKINITGENPNPLTWNVDGDNINVELSEWRHQNFEILSREDIPAINSSIAEYVSANSDNATAYLLLLSYYDRSSDENGYADLISRMRRVENRDKYLKLVAKADQMELAVMKPARLISFVGRTTSEGADTIYMGGNNPGIFLFWQNDMKKRNEMIDSIKALTKEFPDSTARAFADLNLDADSVIWRNSIRRDSLKTVSRLWVPAGLADESLMKLKVGKIPFYIVFDREGRQVYRGENIGDAFNEFRIIVNEKDSI